MFQPLTAFTKRVHITVEARNLHCTENEFTIKVALSPSKKNCFVFFNDSPLKILKNAFLFHHKSSFRSLDI